MKPDLNISDRTITSSALFFRPRIPVILVGLLLVGLALAACVPATLTPTPGPTDDALSTMIAQTVIARQTLEAGFTAVARLTELAEQGIGGDGDSTGGGGGGVGEGGAGTPIPGGAGGSGGGGVLFPTVPTAPATETPTPSPTQTLQPSLTPTPTSLPCDLALYVEDLSAPVDVLLAPGARFTQIWRLRNIGSCTWTPAYSLVLVGGNDFQAGGEIDMPAFVEPGQLVDVAVILVAPIYSGVYTGDWQLSNPAGNVFGIGLDKNGTLPVQIEVAATAQRGVYDLTTNYCQAGWRGPAGLLPCPGLLDDPNGAVVLLSDPDLEDRQENEPTLWVRTASADGSWVLGQYPSYRVEDGDHFRAEIGCLDDNADCDVIFQLDYALETGLVRSLGTWSETSDGETRVLDLDLSVLDGLLIDLILSVKNVDSGTDANAFWLAPHIRNFGGVNELVLSWRYEEGDADKVCQELHIYLLDLMSSEARGVDCSDDERDLGGLRLTDDQHSLLMNWVNRLQSFEAETYTPDGGEAKLVSVIFNGWGDAEVFSSDIEVLKSFAADLYTDLSP